jgi:hypothetical protein
MNRYSIPDNLIQGLQHRPMGASLSVSSTIFTIGGWSDTNVSDVASQPQAVNNTDLRGSTVTDVGRDVHYHYNVTIRFGRSVIVVYKCDADADHDDMQQWKHDDSA